jgi:hypothetical protein
MRRLALVFAILTTVHLTEVLVTPGRVAAAQTMGSRVVNMVRMILAGWRRLPLAVTQRQA